MKISSEEIILSIVNPENIRKRKRIYLRKAPPWSKKEWVIARMPHRKSEESNDSSAPQRRYYHTLEELERMRKMKEKRR